MVEEVYQNIWKIEVPLPKSPLKFLNAYVIVGDKRNFLIDTGFNRQECRDALTQGIEKIGISMAHLVYLYNLKKISLRENKYYEFSNIK